MGPESLPKVEIKIAEEDRVVMDNYIVNISEKQNEIDWYSLYKNKKFNFRQNDPKTYSNIKKSIYNKKILPKRQSKPSPI